MTAMTIEDVAGFMRQFLLGETFDHFLLKEGEVTAAAAWQVEGSLNADFFTSDEQEALAGRTYALWSEIRPMVTQLMKGKKLPVSFAFVLQLSGDNTRRVLERYHLEQLQESSPSLVLTIRYRQKKLMAVTGISYSTFVMDRTLEQLWDDMAGRFLKQHGIPFEAM